VRIENDASEFLDRLFFLPADYDTARITGFGTTVDISRAKLHHLLYSYVINRSAAMLVLHAENYSIKDSYSSPTDAAFEYFYNKLKATRLERKESNEQGGVLAIKDEKASRAFQVFTKQPMKFMVQRQVWIMMQPEEMAIFAFEASADDEGTFDTTWDYVSKGFASCFYGDENYEF